MADGTIKTVLEISGEGSYRNKLKEIGQALKGVASEERVLNAEFGKGDASLGKLTQQHALLENKLKLQKERLQAVRQEYERVVQAEGKNSTTAKRLAIEYNNCQAQVKTTEGAIKELAGQIDKSSGAWNRMAGWIDKNEQKLNRIGTTISNVAGKINKALTAATTAVVGYSAKAFMDFEDQMAIVGTIADETEVSLAELGEQALAASDATGQAATEIAAATYQAISAGADTAHAVDLVEKAAKGAKAGLSDTTTVVDGLTTAMNAWKISYDQSETVLDKMITTQNVGKTTLGDLANNMGKVTAFAPQVGVSLDEVLAATAALTKNGYGTESAMTALKNVMSAVIKPTSQAKEAAKAMGLEFDAAALRSKGLVGFLQDVISKTKGDEAALASLFGSVEGLGGVMLLAGGAAGDFSDALGQIRNSSGALNEAFDKRTSSRAEQMAMALNRLKNAAISFGQTLAPYIDMAAGAIEKLADKLGSMSEGEQKTLLQTALWTIGLTKFVSIAGSVTSHLGGITKAVSSVSKGLSSLATAGSGTAGAGLKALLALGAPGAIALGALAGVVAVSVHVANLDTTMDEAKEELRKGADPEKLREGLDAIENSKIEARALAEVEVDPEIKYIKSSQDLYDEIYEWLTDGEVDTPQQKQQFIDKINTVYDGIVKEITDARDKKLGHLQEQYDKGVIDYDTLVKKTEEVETQASTALERVEGLRGEALDYVNTYAGASTSVVEGTVEHVKELKEEAQTVADEIKEITKGMPSAQTEQRTTQQKALDAGHVTVESVSGSIASAAEFGEINKENIKANAQAQAEEVNRIYNEEYAKAAESGDAEGLAQIEKKRTEQLEAIQQQEEQELAQNASKTLANIQEDFQQAMAGMDGPEIDLLKLYGLKDELDSFDGLDAETMAGFSEPLKAQLRELAKGMFGDEDFFTEAFESGDTERVSQLTNALKQQLATIDPEALMGSLQGTDLGAILSGLFEANVLDGIEGIDTSSAEDVLGLMLGQIVESADSEETSGAGRDIGESVMTGAAEGIQTGSASALTAMDAAGLALINAAKGTLGVHSPSTVFAEIGRNMMQGLRNGIANNRRAVSAALTQLGSLLRNAGRQSMQGWINGVNGMRGALVSAYSAVARAAAAAARAELQIKSPSRVFARIGEYTAEGMIAGVNARAGAVRRSIEDMVDAPQPRRRGGSPALAGAGGATTVNNYTTYNVPYSGIYGSREARRLSQALARAENARKKGRGA